MQYFWFQKCIHSAPANLFLFQLCDLSYQRPRFDQAYNVHYTILSSAHFEEKNKIKICLVQLDADIQLYLRLGFLYFPVICFFYSSVLSL